MFFSLSRRFFQIFPFIKISPAISSRRDTQPVFRCGRRAHGTAEGKDCRPSPVHGYRRSGRAERDSGCRSGRRHVAGFVGAGRERAVRVVKEQRGDYPLAVGGGGVDRPQDWLRAADPARTGQAPAGRCRRPRVPQAVRAREQGTAPSQRHPQGGQRVFRPGGARSPTRRRVIVGALAESVARDGRSRGGRRTARAAEGKDVASFLLPRGTGMSRRVSQKMATFHKKPC